MTVYDGADVQSFSTYPRCAIPCRDPGLLFLGQGASIFLNMRLPPLLGLQSLERASLMLFKIPMCRCPSQCLNDQYLACPLLDFYSVYGCAFAPPCVDCSLKTPFFDDPCRCALEIDITAIVAAWLNGTPENRGLMLAGPDDARCIVCASDRHEIPAMRPMLRLVSRDIVLCRPLRAEDCIVTVQGGAPPGR